MSVKVMGAVWDTDLPRAEKYVLLAYADHAAHDGTEVYPSVGRTAWKTGYSRRSIQKITSRLVDRGILIEIGTRDSGVKKYRVDFSKLPARSPYRGGAEISPPRKNDTGGGEKKCKEGRNFDTRTVNNRHDEPSVSKGPSGPGSLPHNFEGWLSFIKDGDGNAGGEVARLGRMACTFYPHYEPDYARIGRAIQQVGGARRLAHLLWHSQVYRVTGDPVDYAVAMHTRGNSGKSILAQNFETLQHFLEGQ